MGFLEYENIKATEHKEKACSTQEMLELKKFYEELNKEEQEVIESQWLFEKRSILQVLNLKSVEKRIKGSQQIVESVTLPPVPTSMKEPDSTETSIVESMKNVTEPSLGCKKQRLPSCSENPEDTAAISMLLNIHLH